MKYIVARDSDGNEEMFIFSNKIYHSCFAESIEGIRNHDDNNWERVFRQPVSAGFIVNGECTGRSESLDLDSRPQDTLIFKNM